MKLSTGLYGVVFALAGQVCGAQPAAGEVAAASAETRLVVTYAGGPDAVRVSEEGTALAAQRRSARFERATTAVARIGLAASRLRHMTALDADVIVVSGLTGAKAIEAFAAQLKAADPAIVAVEQDVIVRGQARLRFNTNDPQGASQWELEGANNAYATQVRRLWGYQTPRKVAVLDSGDLDHPDLPFMETNSRANFVVRNTFPNDFGDWSPACPGLPFGVTFNSTWHGLAMHGLIGASTGNGVGAVGSMGPGSSYRIMPVKVLGACLEGRLSDVADAIAWVGTTDAVIVNLSLAGQSPCPTFLSNVIAPLAASGRQFFVASAGNVPRGASVPASAFTPANCPGVISVGAIDRWGSRAPYSAHSASIYAPGGNTVEQGLAGGVLTLRNPGTTSPVYGAGIYVRSEGTSEAAALVSGALSLLPLPITATNGQPLTGALLAGLLRQYGRWVNDGVGNVGRSINACSTYNYILQWAGQPRVPLFDDRYYGCNEFVRDPPEGGGPGGNG
jgi:serine protease